MKRILVSLLFCMTAILVKAQNSSFVTIFTADSRIARPITIKSSNGTYTLHSEVRINKNLSWWEAYDGKGNKIMQPGGSYDKRYSNNGSSVVIRYHLTTLYPSSGSSYSKKPGSGYTSYNDSREARAERRQRREEEMQNRSYDYGYSSASTDCSFQVGIQASTFFGESRTARLDFLEGSDITLYGGIGKDLFKKSIPDGVSPRKFGYFAAFGGYTALDDNIYTYLLGGYGRRQWDDSGYLFGTVEFIFYPLQYVGLLAGGSVGLSGKLQFEAHLGITFRPFTW